LLRGRIIIGNIRYVLYYYATSSKPVFVNTVEPGARRFLFMHCGRVSRYDYLYERRIRYIFEYTPNVQCSIVDAVPRLSF